MSKLGDIPAFPRERSAWLSEYSKNMVDGPHEGMTYRQWLAGMAMQSVTEVIFPKLFDALSNEKKKNLNDVDSEKLKTLIPELAVACADALIAALEKQ